MPTVLSIRKVLGFCVVLLGILFGAFFLADAGTQEITPPYNIYRLVVWFGVGSLSIIGSLIAISNHRITGLLLLAVSPVTFVMALIRYHQTGIEPAALLIPILPFSLGIFWYLTSRGGWPQLIVGTMSRLRLVVVLVLTFLSLTCLVGIGAVVITLFTRAVVPDCGWQPPSATKRYKGQAVFVATLRDPGIAIVKERFWGLPTERARRVLIAHWGIGHSELNGQTYSIDGRHANGLITRFLPIIDVSHCGRSRPIDDAALDLRILREGPSRSGVRIVGQVRDRDNKPKPYAKIIITGPAGDTLTNTDQQGIFEMTDLSQGQYTVRVEGCDENQNTTHYRCSDSHGAYLKVGDVWGVELRSN